MSSTNIDLFKALWVTAHDGVYKREIVDRSIADLPSNEVLIRVYYSSLNYKDALSASGNRGVTRRYPHTPGIDCSGIVVSSNSEKFSAGDKVIVTGFDLGMNTSGGFGQYICVSADWIVPLPETMDLKTAMLYGTAGFTAAQCVEKITSNLSPNDGQILITGVTGGVGCTSAAILHKLGYSVTGLTGKPDNRLLKQIGVDSVISREDFVVSSAKALLRERWAGVIDTVGGDILANAIKSTAYGGVVASCGNAASHELPITVYPFILRAVSLIGIDSAQTPVQRRSYIWGKLADEWKVENIEQLCVEIKLPELSGFIDLMLEGKLAGRVVVNLGV
nr:YhdH/YhfP family quinone oxidoreductase [Desulfobulbaceae bacterium]